MEIAKTIEKYGKIDVLVNNAAIFFGKSIKVAELSDWHNIMGVNATGTFLGMKYVAPEMAKNGKGSDRGSHYASEDYRKRLKNTK